jgi:hypothetical protein
MERWWAALLVWWPQPLVTVLLKGETDLLLLLAEVEKVPVVMVEIWAVCPWPAQRLVLSQGFAQVTALQAAQLEGGLAAAAAKTCTPPRAQ